MVYCTWKSYKLKLEPFKIFEALYRWKNCFFLDSSLNSNYYLGRYSFLGIEPFFILKKDNGAPFSELRHLLKKYKISLPKNRIPFLGGAVGYLAYDPALLLGERIKDKAKPSLGIADYFFGFYNTVIIIDHLKQLLHIFTIGFPETDYRMSKILACSNIKKIDSLLSGIENKRNFPEKFKIPLSINPQLESNFTKDGYLAAIKKAKEYIKKGDIYQVNLSQTFRAKSNLSAFEIYQRLRKISPAYFNAYFDAGDCQILSSSPERLLRLDGDIVTTRPMKGTRPRSSKKTTDRKFKKDLLTSAKDKAELIMIVDLERNDLGRVCSYNSIKVKKLRELEEYNTVFQTTATVRGRLHKDKDRIDLLRACFPGGSITGCPKIRAMEIIEELEPTRRSIYTGSLGYLSFSGGMDLNILIRTILKKGNEVHFGAGGGIVADSQPLKEYQETLVKARAMIQAIS
jgi:para-aminobenzoate synthetase component 1